MESINETGVQQRNQNMQSSSQTILGYQTIVGRISKRIQKVSLSNKH